MKGERGFSLLEMTIAMAVMGVLMGGAMSLLFRTQVTFEVQQQQAGVRQQARMAFDLVGNELRLAGYQMGNLTEAITAASTNSISFVGDIDDGDAGVPCDASIENATDGGAERVTYQIVSGELLRSVDCWNGSVWSSEITDQVVATNLTGSQALFTYYDKNGNQIVPGSGTSLSSSERAEIRTLAIALNVLDPSEPIETNAEHASFEISGRVRLPNVD